MVLAVVIGIVIGILATLPLIWGTKLARKATATSNIGQAGGLLIGVFGSFIILAVAAIICIIAFRDFTVPFVVAMAAALVIATVMYGIKKQLR